MITKDEIVRKADEFEIHAANVQRDYVFGWVLAGLYSASALQDHLILKGGNCLRKAYFDHSRFSRDLDFSTQGSLAEEFICVGLGRTKVTCCNIILNAYKYPSFSALKGCF